MTVINLNGEQVDVINMTPHALSIYDMDKEAIIATVPSAGMVRVSETVRTVSNGADEVPLVEIVRDPSKLEGLPEEEPGRYIVVSDLAYQAAKPLGRKDLLRAGVAVRDDSGRIIGCQGLSI